jgi:uncharacterized membrane protein YkoI
VFVIESREMEMRTLILAFAVAGCLAAAAPVAAQSVAMAAHPDINLAGFKGDAGTLPKAIAAIESASGGRVVEIRYNNVAGAPGYDVVLAKGSQVSFQRISKPGAGMTELSDKTKPAWMLNWAAREDISIISTAKVSLADAVRTAEAQMSGSPAVAAGVAKSAAGANTDVKAYNVAILQNGEERRVAVDSANGSIIADPGMLAAW